jgi:hypothetical protein
MPAVVLAALCNAAPWYIFENATNNKLTAFNINSMHINTMMALRRVNTPTTPMLNKVKHKMI